MIAIIDYQMGNLRSVQKALQKVGGQAIITGDPQTILSASHVVLPGVGAFGDAMAELNERQLGQVVKDFLATGKPLLGICLGMQLLFESSCEHGTYEGLTLVPGTVDRFQIDPALKVPHMGWNQASVPEQNAALAEHPVFGEMVSRPQQFYFVHSYFCNPTDRSVVALETDYGINFCAAIAKDNLIATQFHPEKSQAVGLGLLERFTKWNP
jgi:glutamine amidotransferase